MLSIGATAPCYAAWLAHESRHPRRRRGHAPAPAHAAHPKPVVPVVDRPFLRHQLDLLSHRRGQRHRLLCGVPPEAVAGRLRRRRGSRAAASTTRSKPRRSAPAARCATPCPASTTPPSSSTATCSPTWTCPPSSRPPRRRRGDPRADPGREPVGLRPRRNRRPTAASPASSRSRSPKRSRPIPSTPASTSSTRRRSSCIPEGANHSIERGFFPGLLARGDRVFAHVHRGYWIDIGTPEKYLQVHRDVLRQPFPGGLDGEQRGGGWVHPTASVSPPARPRRSVLRRRRLRRRKGRRSGPTPALWATWRSARAPRWRTLWHGKARAFAAAHSGAAARSSAQR